jgi:hypothetical protein
MPYFNQTNNPEGSAQIDTIGWVVVMFVVAVATITGIALYVSSSSGTRLSRLRAGPEPQAHVGETFVASLYGLRTVGLQGVPPRGGESILSHGQSY